jgi:hypothetical protein
MPNPCGSANNWSVPRVLIHPDRKQRHQAAGPFFQQADLDHIEVQQILGVVQDVRVQQFDAVLDRHVEHLVRLQIRHA